jgi:hypothetical protein
VSVIVSRRMHKLCLLLVSQSLCYSITTGTGRYQRLPDAGYSINRLPGRHVKCIDTPRTLSLLRRSILPEHDGTSAALSAFALYDF